MRCVYRLDSASGRVRVEVAVRAEVRVCVAKCVLGRHHRVFNREKRQIYCGGRPLLPI